MPRQIMLVTCLRSQAPRARQGLPRSAVVHWAEAAACDPSEVGAAQLARLRAGGGDDVAAVARLDALAGAPAGPDHELLVALAPARGEGCRKE
jgi:hypothetical protein